MPPLWSQTSNMAACGGPAPQHSTPAAHTQKHSFQDRPLLCSVSCSSASAWALEHLEDTQDPPPGCNTVQDAVAPCHPGLSSTAAASALGCYLFYHGTAKDRSALGSVITSLARLYNERRAEPGAITPTTNVLLGTGQ